MRCWLMKSEPDDVSIDDLEQRVVHFRVHVAGMPLFNFGDKGIALEKGIALLVDVKLFQT